ncbi:TlpA disulfide reductase family protein [Chitinophaga pollutisoli]|uniref:TlpA disulfide reductase family protein n=1 Tax=Chitinophaga pollutisoli TaxID=3133966 RepID=A0ABZ2YTT0_9BACT
MKSIQILPAVLLLPALVHAQTKYTVKGKVGKHNEPVKSYLVYTVDGDQKRDSAFLKNGEFSFSGTVPGITKATILFSYGPDAPRSSNEQLKIYLEPGTVTIKSADSLKNASVKGGIHTNDQVALDALLKPVGERNKALMARYYASSQEQKKDSVWMSAIMAESKQINDDEEAILKKFAESHTKSAAGLEALKAMAGSVPDYATIQPMFAKLAPAVQSSPDGKAYAEMLEKVKAVSIGAIAPDFTQNDPEGNPIALSSFRGKYVLIDFWASWCGPCRAENPHVVKAYNEYKDKNFTILGVSLDQPTAKDKWLKAIADDGLTWPQVSDLKFWKNEAAALYAVRAIPQNFLLDPQGKIIAKNLRGDALAAKLAEVIK